MFVADRCGNQVMKLDALRMAYDEIKKGENTNLFKEVVEKIDGKLGSEYCLDQSWVDSVDRKAEVRKEKLESELNAYRTNLIIESIRMGYNDFGDFYHSHGHLGDALESYARTRDYCTNSKHILQMCLNAILVSIEMGQFTLAASYVSMAEQTPGAKDPVTLAKLRCVAGLAHLESKEYKLAAGKFLETGPDLRDTYTEVVTPQDVAIYGGLCALASFEYNELKDKVVQNFNLRRNFLELAPEIWEIVYNFYSSEYASCLKYLEDLKTNLLLDIHLHDHVEMLYREIRHKALIQYTLPMGFVDLDKMAEAFRTDVSVLEEELVPLISEYHMQLKSQSRAASCEVDRCLKLVLHYKKAIAAIPNLEKSTYLEDEINSTVATLNDKKLYRKQITDLHGKRACFKNQVKMLKPQLHDAVEGKSKDELENLLKMAETEFDKAEQAMRVAKELLQAVLGKKFGTIIHAQVSEYDAYTIRDGRKVRA